MQKFWTKTKKILMIVYFSLLTLFLVSNIYNVVARNLGDDLPFVFGLSFISYQGTQLEPDLNDGDMLMVFRLNETGKANLKNGDLIVFDFEGSLAVSFVQYVLDDSYITGTTDGRANATVNYDQIYGKVLFIGSNLGGFINFVNDWLFLILLLLFYGLSIWIYLVLLLGEISESEIKILNVKEFIQKIHNGKEDNNLNFLKINNKIDKWSFAN